MEDTRSILFHLIFLGSQAKPFLLICMNFQPVMTISVLTGSSYCSIHSFHLIKYFVSSLDYIIIEFNYKKTRSHMRTSFTPFDGEFIS